MSAYLEHVNFTVPDPDRTADWLCALLGWQIRWRGEAIHGGHTVHVGSPDSYLAIYTGPDRNPQPGQGSSYSRVAGLNHVGLVVDDLDAIREKVVSLGFSPGEVHDYEPGRRFYFRDENDIEFEIVSYG